MRLALRSFCRINSRARVADNEMKKYGGSRLLNSLRPDLHNHHGHVGKEYIRKRLFLSPIAKPRQEAGAALRILLMDRTFHLHTDAQAEGQGLGGGKEIGGKL